MAKLRVPILIDWESIKSYMEQHDIVEVVRCRECQNWETDWEPSNFDPKNPRYYCGKMDGFPKGDWYCSQGQRRKEEHSAVD